VKRCAPPRYFDFSSRYHFFAFIFRHPFSTPPTLSIFHFDAATPLRRHATRAVFAHAIIADA